jgi:UPF0271 protein
MITIDLNCDLGEGMPNDGAIMPYISSANIACGFHAGDEAIIRKTISLALAHNVAIGAHPGFPDRANFGRAELPFSTQEIYNTVAEQLNLLQRICNQEGATLHHVKPHGALYNMAARNEEIAQAIARAVFNLDGHLILYGLSGSKSITEAKKISLKTASEVFGDRRYQDNGSLVPRTHPNALIADKATSVKQVLQMIMQQSVNAVNNKTVPIIAETICIHGDGDHAVEFAKNIHQTLKENNIIIQAI